MSFTYVSFNGGTSLLKDGQKKAMLEHLSGNWDSTDFKYISTVKNFIGLPYIYSPNMILSLNQYAKISIHNSLIPLTI